MAIYQDNRDFTYRLRWLTWVIVVLIGLFFTKLWYLSVIRFEFYADLAERNRVRLIPQFAPRGLVVDREGRVLVDNVYGFDLVLFRDEMKDLVGTDRFLVQGEVLEPGELEERIRQAAHYSIYQPLTIRQNLSMEDLSYLLSHRVEHSELEIFKQPRRLYRHGELAAHLLGHVGEVSREELRRGDFEEAKPGDVVGKSGLERTYNRRLTGEDGLQRVLVNSRGKALSGLETVPPVPGDPLQLTIDLDLQRLAEEQLGDRPGTAIAFDPRSGEILALTSRPAFDPNWFATRITAEKWEALLTDPDHPLQNLAIQGIYSPGSVFKVVMALAGLERGAVDLSTRVECRGSVYLHGHRFHCWKAEGHGRIGLVEAIQQSCNVFFYLLGQDLGIEEIADFSRRVGLGSPTGIDLQGEALGLIPTPEWKRRETGLPWYAGETISVAIGQGPVNVTPIQLARAMGVVSTGRVPPLHLASGVRLGDEGVEALPDPEFSPDHLQAVREGLWRVVNQQGTGRGARVAGFDVCGKTGTVQTISRETRARLSEEAAEKFAPNAWFVGFAPRDAPEIVVAVLVERSVSGSASAAPIAGKLFELYHKKKQSKLFLAGGTQEAKPTAVRPEPRIAGAGGGSPGDS